MATEEEDQLLAERLFPALAALLEKKYEMRPRYQATYPKDPTLDRFNDLNG